MNAFEFAAPRNAAEVSNLLADSDGLAMVIAGGTDLLGEVKQGIVNPARLVSLHGMRTLKGIGSDEDGMRIGSMTTVADIAAHPRIRTAYAVLAQACDSVATPQIRNVGTLGGNLCQRPRCWYYRSSLFNCLKKGGDRCFAIGGANKFHAIFGVDTCPAVHPSDTAVALSALDARVLLMSPDGVRTLPIIDFFSSPDVDVTVENVLCSGEILAEVVIPPASPNSRSVYLKAKERQAMDFALSSVALVVDVDGDAVSSARLVLGGVAPVPHRALSAETEMTGKRVDDVDAEQVGRLAVEGATPLSDNGYKVRLTSGLVSRAVRTLLSQDAGK